MIFESLGLSESSDRGYAGRMFISKYQSDFSRFKCTNQFIPPYVWDALVHRLFCI